MNWKFIILSVFSLTFYTSVQAQYFLNVKKSEYLEGDEERKSTYKKILHAVEFGQKGEGLISQAIPLLKEAYRLNSKNAELNYNLGVCYLISGPRNEALPYLESAQKLNADISEDIHFLLGMAHQYRNDFDKAIVQFKINIELIRQNNYKDKQELIELSEKRIGECKNGKRLLNSKPDGEIELMKDVNSVYDEFNPVWAEKVFYFSSRRGNEKDARSLKDHKFYEKIFGKDASGDINGISVNVPNKSNFALMSFDDDIPIIYLGGEGNGDVYFAKSLEDKWGKGKALKFINESNSRESSVCLCRNGNEIYFVSDRKGGFGNCDIYYCLKDENGKWSKPVNIGGDINTEFDEGDVFVTKDGRGLYFSSKGHSSIGGYDIFKCERKESGEWGRPQNMGFPINSTDNDITYFEDETGRFYFASERSGGVGGFDIYREKEIIEKIEEPVILVKQARIQKVPNELENEKMLVPVAAKTVVVPDIPTKQQPEVIEEIKMKEELVQEDFVYRVQIAACKREMGPTDLFERYKGGGVIEHLYVEGWHKYTIGGFTTFEEAAKYRDACGVQDAFVVIFKGGYRLGIAKKTGGVK
ncbi:tetratricopeptide repeat protein [Marinifilum fragile]|uniref:tetratricopeptide repeat protein n=1 Tax=Marinifilum fragile TaxID=570161 RepID=UPI0006CF788C|nr:tetratricopeptide repeat protein [Marinifilum fragile]